SPRAPRDGGAPLGRPIASVEYVSASEPCIAFALGSTLTCASTSARPGRTPSPPSRTSAPSGSPTATVAPTDPLARLPRTKNDEEARSNQAKKRRRIELLLKRTAGYQLFGKWKRGPTVIQRQ